MALALVLPARIALGLTGGDGKRYSCFVFGAVAHVGRVKIDTFEQRAVTVKARKQQRLGETVVRDRL